MALAFIPRRTAERHAVIERAVVADFSGLADHDAHAVIDEKTPADLRARVNFDAGEKAANMRDHARKPAQALAPEPVREPVDQQRMKAGIAGDDFPRIAGRRVALEDDRDFFFQA